MKRFYYQSWIAKTLLAFSACHTITIGPFVFSKLPKEEITQSVRNHETCHSCQWTETAGIAACVVLILQLIFDISPLWYIVAALTFYIWYVIEWLVRLCIYWNFKIAYRAVSFEREAYSNELDCDYIENRPLFSGWLRYVVRR